MKFELEKSHRLPVSAAAAWRLLQDIESVAACMPGAKITEKIDDTHYRGTVSIRLGPATASFKGDIEIKGVDAIKRELKLVGKGSDTGGQSGASMHLTAWLQDSGPNACELIGRSEVMITGKVAAFGGRMMGTVSEQILKQFFDNFSARLQESGAQPAAAATAETVAGDSRPPVAARSAEINGLAISWAIVKNFFHRLFTKKKAT